MEKENKPIIVCENLVKIYKVADLEVVALQGLELVVQRGEMLGIVGTSGSGKSTFMNILGGIDRPSAGRVFVDDIDLLTLSDSALNRYQREKVGFVWQQTGRNLIAYLTAQENVELPMTMTGNHTLREKHEWAEEMLNAVGLYQRRHHNLTQLSGGEQQRVAIAVALANKPVILLGDEPTGEVDTATAQTIMDTFRSMSEKFGLTTVIVTHDPRIAGQVDRVVAIRDGKTSTETIRQVSQLEHVMAGDEHPDIQSLALVSSDHSTIAPVESSLQNTQDVQPRNDEPAQVPENKATEENPTASQNVIYHEYVVLDSAGRLQVPREFLDELGIGKRAELEKGENCIVIRPAAGQTQAVEKKDTSLEDQIDMLFKDEPPPPKRGFMDRLKQMRRR